MLRLGVDEDFSGMLLRALRRRFPEIDIERFPEINRSIIDERVLDWAQHTQRVLFSHDVNTLKGLADRRVVSGGTHPGVFIVPQYAPLEAIIEDIITIAVASFADEWRNQAKHLPLR